MILTRSELSTDGPSSACGSISGLIVLEGETTRGSCPTHSSGVSTMRSITPRNASRTPIAVFADVSTNRQPIRGAYAAASTVGTCRACSWVVSNSDQERKRPGWGSLSTPCLLCCLQRSSRSIQRRTCFAQRTTRRTLRTTRDL
jgi:hypothetical protein